MTTVRVCQCYAHNVTHHDYLSLHVTVTVQVQDHCQSHDTLYHDLCQSHVTIMITLLLGIFMMIIMMPVQLVYIPYSMLPSVAQSATSLGVELRLWLLWPAGGCYWECHEKLQQLLVVICRQPLKRDDTKISQANSNFFLKKNMNSFLTLKTLDSSSMKNHTMKLYSRFSCRTSLLGWISSVSQG
jgi:hypothetical protein